MSLHLDSGHLTHHPLTRILHPARTRATPITIGPSAPVQDPVRLWPSYDSDVNQPTPFIPPKPSSDRSSSPSFLEMPSPRDSTYPHPSLRSHPVPTSPALPYSVYPRPAVPPVSSVIPTFNRDFGVASENIAPVIPYVPPEVWPWPPLRLQTRLIRDGEGLYYDSDTSSPISPDARETSNDEREVSSPVQTEIPVADLIQLSPPNPTIDIPDEIIEPEFDGNADPRSPRSTSRQPLPTIMEVSSSELSSTEPTTPDRWTLTLSAPSRNLSESSNNITDPALTMRTIFDY
ncbi:hypothetical protein K435DRAFT_338629 [Dendrothele bispora CBS 962.96]|uniref:Uncharacterized protein n=1 Tax=Dendrothele bispora (strain CBS 962.96) TaxID=1314807 RepID=A0A4S8MIP6_DENBC|nr:hypothetical protein K435DRAFT_338629 [Dendrothele bispora CBS 962.96]